MELYRSFHYCAEIGQRKRSNFIFSMHPNLRSIAVIPEPRRLRLCKLDATLSSHCSTIGWPLSSGSQQGWASISSDRPRLTSFSWHQTRHDLPAVTSINLEISISRHHEGVRQGFAHAHEAGVGQAHGYVRIFFHQGEDGHHV